MKCPECGSELKFIANLRMDEKTEIIPVCDKCGVAFRHPDLGWRIIENDNAEI